MSIEIRFTETNGIRCWRCCPLPLKPSGECTCECHRRRQQCHARIWNRDPRQPENVPCSRLAAEGTRFCWQHGRRNRKTPTPIRP